MSKSNLFVKYFKNIFNSINNLLERNLNKLKFNNLINLATNNKIVLTFVAVFVLSVSYLLIPTFYKQNQISNELKSELLKKLNLNFKFSKNLNYNFFPRPHFTSNETTIFSNNQEISKIKKIKIYVSLENLFSLKNVKVNDVVIENANFNLNNKNYSFFLKILDNDFYDIELKIKNSNIFFKNKKNEVLFINKILNMKYYYDTNELKNIIILKNEIFNIPYELELYKNKSQNKILSKLNFNFLKLQIENELIYVDDIKTGEANLTFDKLKSKATYEANKDSFNIKFFDKIENPKFIFDGRFNFQPFYSNLNGRMQELNLSYLFDGNSFISQALKTEIFNNKNIDFKLNLQADNLYKNINFENIILNLKMQEGLIDFDNTIFTWKNFVNFKLVDSLIFTKNGELIMDGKLEIDVNNYNQIYKYLLTPKNFRKRFNKVEFSFSYNIDQKSIDLRNIKIDDNFDQNINKTMSNIILKNNNLQNRIHLKNFLNKAFQFYAG